MRDYSKVSPRFWTGDTGRQIRKMGHETQVIAFYLFTCPSANMLGLYYLSLPTLCHETGSSFEGASKALRSLSEAHFAYYDEASEQVFVPNMAREQIGERLKSRDNRHVAVLKELDQLKKSPFFHRFVDTYKEAFELPYERNSEAPYQAPSKSLVEPLRSQEQEQEQEQEQKEEQEPEHDLAGPVPKPNGKHAAIPGDVERVFDHWRTVWKKPKAKLDPKRQRAIKLALKDFTADQVCESLTGYGTSPFHRGKNDRNTVYDEISRHLCDVAHIEKGIELAGSGGTPGTGKDPYAGAI